jgi:hypothetical protein
MTELTKPLQKPRFATGGSAAITEPPEFKKDLGWIVEAPPHNFFNWLHKYTYDWLQYLESKQDVDLGAQPTTTLTIASGVITPTRGVHSVDTEAMAGADDLTNIVTTNLDNGRLLLLRTVSDSRDVTIKHAAGGAGQIFLRRGVDLALTESALWILLIRDGTDWREVFSRPYLQDDPNPTLTANLVAGAAGLDIGSLAQRFDEVFATISDATTTLTQRVDRRDVGVLKIGDQNANQVDIGRAGATVNVYGDVINVETTNANVTDKLITINKGGAASSGGLSGHDIEENGSITGFMKTLSDRTGWQMKAPANANIASLKPAPNVPLVGMLPLGAVIAIFPHMTGAYNCTATTAADANGFVQCNGQTIADATSPMNGQVVPNINDSAFLMGTTGTTSSTTASANTKDLSHTHSVTSNVAVADHGNHTHQVTSNVAVSDHSAHTHAVTSNVTVADHAAHTHIAPAHYHGMGTDANLATNIGHTHAASAVTGTTNIFHTHAASTVTINKNQWNSDQNAHSHFMASNATTFGNPGAAEWNYGVNQISSGGATATWNSVNATGSAAGQTLTNPTNISLASGSAAGQTLGTTNVKPSGLIGLVTGGVDGNAAMTSGSGGPTTHTVTNNAVTSGSGGPTTHTVTNGTVTSANESTTLTHTVTNNAVTSGSSLSSTFDIRPKYIACRYIMRIA